MNKVILTGRLASNPELRVTAGEQQCSVTRFRFAVPKTSNREEAHFFNVVCWNSKAEFADKYLRKGMKIVLSGELEDNSYTDKDGNYRTFIEIKATELEFAESKPAEQ